MIMKTPEEIYRELVELNKDYCNSWVNPRLVISTSNPDFFRIYFDRFSGIYVPPSTSCILFGIEIKDDKMVANFQIIK